MSARSCFFALNADHRPIGGTNILIRMAQVLKDHGHDIAILHNEARYRYTYLSHDVPVFFDPRLRGVMRSTRYDRSLPALKRRFEPVLRGTKATARRLPAQGDVVVIPEYRYPELTPLYPDAVRVLAAQDVMGFFRAYLRDAVPQGGKLADFDCVFATSEASFDAVTAVHDGPVGRINLPVGFRGLDYAAAKKRQIAYMPRKRPDEVRIVTTALRNAPETRDYDLVAIDRMGQDEMVGILKDSRFFLSFSQEEGFGLPPAEAMRAGCIVIGYTGVGANEYFTERTGIVVPDSDVVGLINTVRRTAAAYDADPAPFDALRKQASDHIAAAYSQESFEASVRDLWSGI